MSRPHRNHSDGRFEPDIVAWEVLDSRIMQDRPVIVKFKTIRNAAALPPVVDF